MSSDFHPGRTRQMATELVDAISDTTGEPVDRVAVAERALNIHACRAAGFAGNDPSHIYRHIWYRSDGWGHGGSAITWKERAEELEAELAVKNALVDRAKDQLDNYLNGIGSARATTKLLTDIEHL